MTDTTYNGWSNYATWRVNLEMCDDMLQDRDAIYPIIQSESPRADLADYLKEQCEEYVCGDDHDANNIATQYALAFLGQVNWWEIAENFLNDN